MPIKSMMRRQSIWVDPVELDEDKISEHQEEFFATIRDGNISTFMDLLSRKEELGIDLDYEDSNGDTALKIAIKEGYSVLVKLLLNENVKVHDALLKAVDVGFIETVKVICDYASTLPTRDKRYAILDCRCDNEEFHPDVTPIILAAQRNDFQLVEELLNAGVTIPESVKEFSSNTSDSLRQSVGQLEVFKGLASEAYVTLKYPDPVDKAFVLSSKLQRLSETDVTFKPYYLDLVETLNSVGTDVISQARSTEEILTVLSHHDQKKGNVNMGPLPKLIRAIQFGQRKFVAESNCQQALLSKFYGRMTYIRDKSAAHRLLILLLIMVAYPVLSIWYMYMPGGRIKTKLESPYVKFAMHLAADFYFIVLITADVLIGDDIMSFFTINRPTRALVILWTFGLAWQIINQARKKQVIANINRSTNWQNGLFVGIIMVASLLDLLSLYVQLDNVNGVTSQTGYRYNPGPIQNTTSIQFNQTANASAFPLDESLLVNNSKLKDEDLVSTTSPPSTLLPLSNDSVLHVVPVVVNPKGSRIVVLSGPAKDDIRYDTRQESSPFYNTQWWHPRLISSAMFSMATVMAFMRMLPYVVVSDTLGPLQISLGSMLTKTLHFFVVFFGVIFAIAIGITYIYSYPNAADYQTCVAGQAKESCKMGPLANIFKVLTFLYWSLFGLANRDDLLLGDQSAILENTAFFLYGFFYVLVVLVLLNALIAVMSEAYNEVEENADVEWKFASSTMWIRYLYDGGVVPPPFNLLPSFKDMYRVVKYVKDMRDDKTKKNNKRLLRLMNEGLEFRPKRVPRTENFNDKKPRRSPAEKRVYDRRRSSQYAKTQYERIMARLVERYVASKTASDVSAEADVSSADIRALRNDLLSLKFEIYQKMQGSISNIDSAIGESQKTHEKSIKSNKVFNETATLHSKLHKHLKYVFNFDVDLRAAYAAIPDPPETMEHETQTKEWIPEVLPGVSGKESTATPQSNAELANAIVQTSTNWMESKKVQASFVTDIQETAMQTTREYYIDEMCQTIPPKPDTTNVQIQTHAFTVNDISLPVAKIKKRNGILSCFVSEEIYQTSAAPSKVTSSDMQVQTNAVISTGQGTQTSKDCEINCIEKETPLKAADNVVTSNEIAIQATDEESQTQLPSKTEEVLLQTMPEEFMTDRSMQTTIDVKDITVQMEQEVAEMEIQATECVVNGESQTLPSAETKEVLIQTANADFITDSSVQASVDAEDVTAQTTYDVVEMEVQATESLVSVTSQTPIPEIQESISQTTWDEFITDSSIQASVDVKEVTAQTTYDVVEMEVQATESLVSATSQTPIPEIQESISQTTWDEFITDSSIQASVDVKEVTAQVSQEVSETEVQATECLVNVTSQTTIVEKREAFLQTSREFLKDISQQTTIKQFEEIHIQASEEQEDTETQTNTTMHATSVQTTIKEFDDKPVQCAPPVIEEKMQTCRDYLHDIGLQFAPICEDISAQTQICVSDLCMQTDLCVSERSMQTCVEYESKGAQMSPFSEEFGAQTEVIVKETSIQTIVVYDTAGIQCKPEVIERDVQTEEDNVLASVRAAIAAKIPFIDISNYW